MASITTPRPEDLSDHHGTIFSDLCKRKSATSEADTSAPKRHCAGSVQRDESPNVLVHTSLNAAMRAERTSRLYVHPIAWTERHLQLLSVNFDCVKKLSRQCIGDQSAVTRDESRATVLPWNADDSLRAVEHLVASNVDLQRSTLTDLLRSYGMRSTEGSEPCRRINMLFRRQTACHLKTEGIWQAKAGNRMMAYINFDTISELRHKWVHGRHGAAGRNAAGLELKRKREKALKPKKAHEDPYIFSLLIALAQAQRRLDPEAERWEVHLLAIPGIKARRLYYYKGSVPAQLLKRLDEPSSEVACPEVVISIVKISLRRPREAARGLWEELHENEFC
ncbi:hypothetical protein MY10362_009346 [Beauveria mimosiformis]